MSPKIEQDSLISESELDDMMLGDQDMFGKSRVDNSNTHLVSYLDQSISPEVRTKGKVNFLEGMPKTVEITKWKSNMVEVEENFNTAI